MRRTSTISKPAKHGGPTAYGLIVVLAVSISACTKDRHSDHAEVHAATIAPVTPGHNVPVDMPGLHNVVAYHDGFFSGSVPDGGKGFDTLAQLGVKTVISVDGARPEVEEAHARGLRYIHLPIGYNGFDKQRGLELARATRDAMKHGSVYVHCHHGKHRSAAAAASVGVSLGWMSQEEGVRRMEVSGTSASYRGLYACVRSTSPADAGTLDVVQSAFPSVSEPGGLVQGMIDADVAMDNLKAIQAAGWKVPASHPDLVPAAEAGRVADVLRMLLDMKREGVPDAGFIEGLRKNQTEAERLEVLLADQPGVEPKALSEQFKRVQASCKACHAAYRD